MLDNREVWVDFVKVATQIFAGVNSNKTALFAANPVVTSPVSNLDLDILRLAIVSELDATSLYEQMAAKATDPVLIQTLLDVAKEEKTHVGEFQSILLRLDPVYQAELIKGKDEIEEKYGNTPGPCK